MTTIFGLRGTDEQIDVLRARLLATRWPSYDSHDDWSLGTSSDNAKRLVQYWATQFDFDSLWQRLAPLPHEYIIIDDVTVHLVHVRSPHPQAVPVIITHGWPSSFLEIVPLIERMTQPERFGGRAEDACHLVIPSLPGFGFSSPARTLEGYTGAAIADLWACAMTSLGYERFFASGGDIGARVTSWLGVRHPQRVRGIHVSSNALRLALPGEAIPTADEQAYLAHKITCPVMVLWADERLVASGMETGALTASDVWRRWADDVRGFDIACGHLLPEQAAEAVMEKVVPFLDASLQRALSP